MLSWLLSRATSELKKCCESITSVTLWVLIDLIFVKFKEIDRLKTEKCQFVSALSLPVASSQQDKRLYFNTLKPPGSSNYLVSLIVPDLFSQTFLVKLFAFIRQDEDWLEKCHEVWQKRPSRQICFASDTSQLCKILENRIKPPRLYSSKSSPSSCFKRMCFRPREISNSSPGFKSICLV